LCVFDVNKLCHHKDPPSRCKTGFPSRARHRGNKNRPEALTEYSRRLWRRTLSAGISRTPQWHLVESCRLPLRPNDFNYRRIHNIRRKVCGQGLGCEGARLWVLLWCYYRTLPRAFLTHALDKHNLNKEPRSDHFSSSASLELSRQTESEP